VKEKPDISGKIPKNRYKGTEPVPLAPDFIHAIQEACGRFPAFKARFDRAGLEPNRLRFIQDLESLPLVHEFHAPSENPPDTSGWTEALAAAGITADGIVQIGLSPGMSDLSMALDSSLSEIGAQGLLSGMANFDIQMGIMKDLEVTAFIGGLDFLQSVARLGKLREHGPGNAFNLETAVIIGDRIDEQYRKDLEQKLGTDILMAHHTPGFSCLGYECRHRTGFHWPENILVHIVDRDSGQPVPAGETGDLVLTASTVPDPPSVRVTTGQPAYFLSEPCACGRNAYRLA
jgi:phenylacetate-CoA ligase